MRQSWRFAAVVVIGGLGTTPALAFHKHGCNGGTTGVSTVSIPTTVTTTRTVTRTGPAFFNSSGAIGSAFFGASDFNTTPAFFNSSIATGPAVFGTSVINTTPTVFNSSFTTANPAAVFVNPGVANFGGASVASGGSGFGGSADLNALVQAIQANTAAVNGLTNRLTGGTPGCPGNPVNPGRPGSGIPPLTAPAPIGFGPSAAAAAAAAGGGAVLPDYRYHELAVDQFLRAGDKAQAQAQFVLSLHGLTDMKATVQEWEEANKKMAAKLGLPIPK